MPRQQGHRRLTIIAKERSFDPEKWKQLLSAFAYVLHDERKQREAAAEAANNPAPTKDEP